MTLHSLKKLTDPFNETPKMPVLFIGHGSPMNAIEDNEFTHEWKKIGKNLLQRPNAILCISAHWETEGTAITTIKNPRTIHDFYGFPNPLYQKQYPAPGCPELAENIKNTITGTSINLDYEWGLDHGSWSILTNMFPEANIPIIEMSLDYTKDLNYHFKLAKELSYLRKKGVLIIGSGNLVHNLRLLDWESPEKAFDWAFDANTKLKNLISSGDYSSLINYQTLGKEVLYSIPSTEHFLPSLYALALKEETEDLSFFNNKVILGSLSMASFIIN